MALCLALAVTPAWAQSHYTANLYYGVPDDSSLVGHWTFDEGTGSTAYDSSGNSYTGTWHGTQAGTSGYYSTGKMGPWAGTFDGSTAYVDMGAPTGYMFPNTTFSVAGWFKGTTDNAFILAETMNNGGWGVVLGTASSRCASGQIGYTYKDPSNDSLGACATINVIDGAWHHFVIVARTSTTVAANNTATIYIDGSVVSSSMNNSAVYNTTSQDFQIGKRSTGNSFTGLIDDVRVYNLGLSAAQVAGLYSWTEPYGSVARSATFGRGPSESNTASDAIARVGVFGRGDSESNTASDTVARLAIYSRGDTETNTVSDGLARLASFGRSNSESWIVHGVTLNWDPSSSTGTQPGWNIGYNIFEGDSPGDIGDTPLNDSPVAVDCTSRVDCTYTDLVCNTPFETCYYDIEAVWIQDESQASPPSDIVSGTIPDGASDVLASNQGLGRSASESNTTSDAISRLAGFGRSDSEINTASDGIARLAVYGRDESESQTASDAIARSQGITRQANEANTASDTLARLAGFGRSETESNTTSATVGRLASFMRNDAEALNVTDSLGRIRGLWRGETELLSTSDSLGRVLAARRGDTETLAFADSIVGLRNYRLVVLPRHASAVPGQGKTGAVPGQAKTGVEAGRVKSGTAPVH